MELMEAINTRRSIRTYKPDQIAREEIEQLLQAAVQAPSAMNQQAWAFGVIQDRTRLRNYSDRIKAFLLGKMDEWEWLARYKDFFTDPDYHVFYNAPALIVIYAKNQMPVTQTDCTLAAENLMLAARGMGLGTCWIGFAVELLNQDEVKQELGVPSEYTAVAPIIVGHPDGPPPERERSAPELVYWE